MHANGDKRFGNIAPHRISVNVIRQGLTVVKAVVVAIELVNRMLTYVDILIFAGKR